jgi:hypothetical protein
MRGSSLQRILQAPNVVNDGIQGRAYAGGHVQDQIGPQVVGAASLRAISRSSQMSPNIGCN